MFPDLDQPVHLRGAEPQRPNLCRRKGAGASDPATDRRLQGAGGMRFRRTVFAAARRLNTASMWVLPIVALSLLALGTTAAEQPPPKTVTPIEHLIVVVGENISFDNLFGAYRPKSGARENNVLSQGIVNRDGSPGPDFARAAQRRAEVHDAYQVTPRIVGTYGELPRPGTTHAVGLPRFVPDQR